MRKSGSENDIRKEEIIFDCPASWLNHSARAGSDAFISLLPSFAPDGL